MQSLGTFDMVWTIYFSFYLICPGMLIYRSGFMSGIMGILLLITAAAYLLDKLVKMLLSNDESISGLLLAVIFPTGVGGKLRLALWFMIKGGKTAGSANG